MSIEAPNTRSNNTRFAPDSDLADRAGKHSSTLSHQTRKQRHVEVDVACAVPKYMTDNITSHTVNNSQQKP